MPKSRTHKKRARTATASVDGKQRAQIIADRIVRVLSALPPVIQDKKVTQRDCPHLTHPGNAVKHDMVFQNQDEAISEAIEQIKPLVLELLDQLDLPEDEKERLRRDMQRPEPYLEPQGSIFSIPSESVEDCEAAANRNQQRFSRLEKLLVSTQRNQPRTNGTARLRVDVKRLIVTLDSTDSTDSTEYEVSLQQAVYVDLLIRANGKIVTGRQVLRALQQIPGFICQDKSGFRVTRVADGLPEPIRDFIGRSPGGGSWLLVDRLA